MRFKPKKSGINFLCDTIILPQYYNFEREASHKTDFENFKEIRFECWNIFISAYFMCAVQTALRSIEDNAHIKLLKGTIGYFNQQYPLFETVLKLFLNTFEPENPFCEEMGKLLSANLLQSQDITTSDIKMGCEIAERIFNLVSVIDGKELMTFQRPFVCRFM